jgi:hypothetical protein
MYKTNLNASSKACTLVRNVKTCMDIIKINHNVIWVEGEITLGFQ